MNFPFEARIALIGFLICYFNFQFYHNTFCLLTNKYLRYWLHDEYSWRVNTREPELRTVAATWLRRAAASSSSSCAAWRALSCGQTWASTVNTRIGNNSCHKTMSCRPAHPLCGHQRARSVLGHDCHWPPPPHKSEKYHCLTTLFRLLIIGAFRALVVSRGLFHDLIFSQVKTDTAP